MEGRPSLRRRAWRDFRGAGRWCGRSKMQSFPFSSPPSLVFSHQKKNFFYSFLLPFFRPCCHTQKVQDFFSSEGQIFASLSSFRFGPSRWSSILLVMQVLGTIKYFFKVRRGISKSFPTYRILSSCPPVPIPIFPPTVSTCCSSEVQISKCDFLPLRKSDASKSFAFAHPLSSYLEICSIYSVVQFPFSCTFFSAYMRKSCIFLYG